MPMAFPRDWQAAPPFPFDNSSLRYYYLARNAIYAVAKLWNLAGQEILFPAYFHGVEIETLLAAGVKPRFYPVHADMSVDAGEIRACFTEQTRAVYLIHYLGFPGPVEDVSEVCRARGVALIEDCALALLSRRGAKPLGSFGDAAIFCFYKTLPAPNGGALLLRDSESTRLLPSHPPSFASTFAYAATAARRNLNLDADGRLNWWFEKLRGMARSRANGLGVVTVGSEHFDPSHAELAMSRLCHWILAAQDFPAIVERRRRNYLHLLDRLKDVAPPVFPLLPDGVCPLSYPLRTRDKLEVLKRLAGRGLEAINLWSTIPPSLPEGTFPEVDSLRRTIVELPCHHDLTPETMDWIAGEVRTLWRDLKE
jgi:dTDP-4-amino-4,6-dideoxygalactose transaminase